MAVRKAKPKSASPPAPYAVVARAYQSALWGEAPEVSIDKLLRQYGNSTTWVYIAVNRIANACAQIPVNIIKKSRKGKPNSIIEGPAAGLRELLDNPNPFQSYFDFVEEGQTYLDLSGNAYIELAKIDKLGRPKEMYWLSPAKMVVVPDEKKVIKGYIYTVNGKDIEYPADEIVHIKYAHPANDYYGFAPLTAARFASETDIDNRSWNKNFINRGAWPAGALETEKDMSEENEARLRSQVQKIAQGGKESVGRLLLLTGGLKYKGVALSPKDMDWLDSRRMSRDEILAIYGVPFSVAGLFSQESTTSRSAGVAQQVVNFYLFTVFPKRQKFLSALNRGLATRYPGGIELVDDVRNIPALKDDVQKDLLRAQTFRTLTTSGWSLEMALAELYPHVPSPAWGKVAWMNSSMVPISDDTNPYASPGGTSGDTVPTDPANPADSGDPPTESLALVRALELDEELAPILENIRRRQRDE